MNLEPAASGQRRSSALFFVALACLLFLPFFAGKFVLGGTDVLFAHYPNLLYGYREFHQFGAFSLWNRYIFCGTDFTRSMHAHFLDPLYWPLLLVPEKYIFHVLTAGFLAANALTGWIWSRISVRLGAAGTGSLIVGTVAQAGMFFWFAMTTMVAVPMYLAASIAIYVVTTFEQRGPLANYLALSVLLAALFVTPHPTYILGFFLPVAATFLVKAYPGWIRRPWRGLSLVFGAACITALLLTAYRLAPVAVGLVKEGSLLNRIWLSEFANHAYFGLTAFNPLAFGIHLSEAMSFSAALHLGSHHTQSHSALYFGLVPMVIVYAAIRAGVSTRVALLGLGYMIFQLTYLYALQPLSDIVNLVFYPLGHEGLYRPATAIAFQFVLIDSLKIFSGITAEAMRKVIRECIVISGLIVAAWFAMYAKVFFNVPSVVEEIGFGAFVNCFRAFILVVVACAVAISTLPDAMFGRLRFGALAVSAGALVVLLADAAAALGRLWPGPEMSMSVLKNEIVAIPACFAILLGAFPQSERARRLAFIFAASAAILFLVRMPTRFVGGAGLWATAWVGADGWGLYIAIMAVTLSLVARLADGQLKADWALKLMLFLAVVDLVVAYRNYSYVDVPSTPFIQRITDIYPASTLMTQSARNRVALAEQSHLGNLLANPGFQRVSDQLIGWSFGGKDMAMCPEQPSNTLPAASDKAVSLCYPRDDEGGNLFQDVSTGGNVHSLAFGTWVLAETGMEVGLFITNASLGTGGPIVQQRGDGRWHWIYTTLEADRAFDVVRCHINMRKSGRAQVYAPRLLASGLVSPASRPADGHQVAEPNGDWAQEIDADSFRVNHVHLINRYASTELMSNFAMIARTPTYAGVDSDIPADYTKLLLAFRAEDPSWYHRAGLTSTLDDNRLLDLLGVGYDIGADGRTLFRPDAIPRFAAFSGFEVQDDPGRGLQRLKAADFDPTRVVLLQRKPPGLDRNANPGRFKQLRYSNPAADRLIVPISQADSRLLLFNDRFSPDWKVDWNGQPLRIVRANVAFMAVALPEGAGQLTFEFRPRLFLMLAKVGAATLAALSTLAAFLLARFWSERRGRHRPQNERAEAMH